MNRIEFMLKSNCIYQYELLSIVKILMCNQFRALEAFYLNAFMFKLSFLEDQVIYGEKRICYQA